MFRLLVLALLAALGRTIGFYGVLAGLAVAELIGVVYMFAAMTCVLRFFRPQKLISDTMRLAAATAVTIAVGVAAIMLPTPWGSDERVMALIKLGEVSLACAAAAWPAVSLTRSISSEEQRMVLNLLTPWRKASPLGNE